MAVMHAVISVDPSIGCSSRLEPRNRGTLFNNSIVHLVTVAGTVQFSSEHHIQYQIYSIPYKEPAPLVCKLSKGYLFTNKWDKNAIN